MVWVCFAVRVGLVVAIGGIARFARIAGGHLYTVSAGFAVAAVFTILFGPVDSVG